MRKGSGDHWLDQPTFKNWCQDPRGVVLAETTPKQIAMGTTRGVASSSYAAASGCLGPLTIHDRRTCRMFTAQSRVGCSSTRRVSGTNERRPDVARPL